MLALFTLWKPADTIIQGFTLPTPTPSDSRLSHTALPTHCRMVSLKIKHHALGTAAGRAVLERAEVRLSNEHVKPTEFCLPTRHLGGDTMSIDKFKSGIWSKLESRGVNTRIVDICISWKPQDCTGSPGGGERGQDGASGPYTIYRWERRGGTTKGG